TSLNRNKKSVTIDLKSEEGKEIFIELVKTADVLVESFRPGVMERLGLAYATLKDINPKLIYCAITGYGQTGPYVQMPGHDLNYISYAGLLNLQGERNRKPVPPAVQIADIGGGSLMAVIGIMMAIQARAQTGKGQFVDISMLDGAVSWLQTTLPNYLVNHQLPNRGELPLSGEKACYEVYETLDRRFLAVGALELKFWIEFCRAIQREDFIELHDAPQNKQDELKTEIGRIIKNKTQDEWVEIFSRYEACVTPVLTFEEMVDNPQIRDRQMIQEIPGLTGKQIGIPIKLSDTPGVIRSNAPRLGEHNKEIFGELKVAEQME
ncbi:MAG TPA: CaiB/BaiF CoA-transferase family protein, partial [Chondromyces sp.]|nr:CaiB/BaiF CoA-transferase family protein [Chondromyces sp.]